MSYSKNGAAILGLLLSFAGLQADQESLVHFISALGTCISFFLMIYHQVMEREDVHNFFFKK